MLIPLPSKFMEREILKNAKKYVLIVSLETIPIYIQESHFKYKIFN